MEKPLSILQRMEFTISSFLQVSKTQKYFHQLISTKSIGELINSGFMLNVFEMKRPAENILPVFYNIYIIEVLVAGVQ